MRRYVWHFHQVPGHLKWPSDDLVSASDAHDCRVYIVNRSAQTASRTLVDRRSLLLAAITLPPGNVLCVKECAFLRIWAYLQRARKVALCPQCKTLPGKGQ